VGGELTFKNHSAKCLGVLDTKEEEEVGVGAQKIGSVKCLGVLDTSNEKEGVGFSAKKT